MAEPQDTNRCRTDRRNGSWRHRKLRVSLQTLSAEDISVRLEYFREKKDNPRLQGIQRVLEELMVPCESDKKVAGILEYQFAYELFASFFEKKIDSDWFRDSILHPEYGIPVLLYQYQGKWWVVLNDDLASLPNVFLQFLKSENDDFDDMESIKTETVNL